jgi:hypothetical protein
MEGRHSDRLWLWIAGSLVPLLAILFLATLVPDADCGEEVHDGAAEIVLILVAIGAALLAVAGALYRLGAMVRATRFRLKDGAVLGTGAPGFDEEGLAIAGLVLTGVALAALIVAAIARRRVDGVGVLLPIYLFGAAWVYLLVGVLILFVKGGGGC